MNSCSSEGNKIKNRRSFTVRPSSCPNPLFEQWLEEWRKEAENRNSDLQYCFGKALKSLKKYPLILKSGQECLILKNFGTQLAVKLDHKLAEYRHSHLSSIITFDIGSSNSESELVPSRSRTNSSLSLDELLRSNKRKNNAQLESMVIPKSVPPTSKINVQHGNLSDYQNSISTPFTYEQLIFLPGEYEIILLVDTQETIGRIRNQIIQETIRELTALKVNFEVRHLKVGDFVWVARNKKNKELVLPYIIERKRMDDLGKSIKDRRFNEQKFRLRQCGLWNIIYLIEKYGTESRLGLPINILNQAVINTQLVDNFFIKTTNNHEHSMSYLSVLTNLLKDLFKDKTLISCPRSELPTFNIEAELLSLQTFQEFSKFSAKNKNMKIQDVFMKHLLQLKGISVEKASIITQKYPTPQLLRNAYRSSSHPEILLANLTFGKPKRNMGPIMSKYIHQLYTNRILS